MGQDHRHDGIAGALGGGENSHVSAAIPWVDVGTSEVGLYLEPTYL